MSKVKFIATIIASAAFGAVGTLTGVAIKNKISDTNREKMKMVDVEEMEFLLAKTRKFLTDNKVENVDEFYDIIIDVYGTFTSDYRKFFITAYDFIDRNDVKGFTEYFVYIKHILASYKDAKNRDASETVEDVNDVETDIIDNIETVVEDADDVADNQ